MLTPPCEVDPPTSFATDPSPQWEFDSLEVDERLRQLDRMLAIDGGAASPGDRWLRIDAAHHQPGAKHAPKEKTQPSQNSPPGKTGSLSWVVVVAWGFLTLGIMSLACGGMLLGWSLVAEREQFWSVGVPIVLVGQVLLLMGFVLQIDRLWSDNRETADKLNNLGHRLDELGHANKLSGRHGPNRSTIDDNPDLQTLLAHLKSQLDSLAVKITDEGS
jgi:hypothetical protein